MKLRVQPSKTKPVAKAPERERLDRYGTVSQWDLEVSMHAADGRFFEVRSGGPTLIARGEFTEPVSGVSAFELMLIRSAVLDMSARCLGFFMRAKPVLDGSIYLTQEEFSALKQFAAADHNLYVGMTFQKPRYGSAEIYAARFSTVPAM